MKKMKKRRELDALVNLNGKSKAGRRKKGQHELLQNDSDSSDVEEFSIPPKSVLRNNNSCRFCATCTMVCGFFLLVLCIAAIAGLVWVHIELKKEVDQLRTQLNQAQTSPQKSLSDLKEKHNTLEQAFSDFKAKDFDGVQTDINQVKEKVDGMRSDVDELSKKAAQAPAKTPDDSPNLAKDVAKIGSDVKSLQDQCGKCCDEMEKFQDEQPEKFKELTQDIDSLNSSMLTHFHEHSVHLQRLHNVSESNSLRLGLLEVKPASVSHENLGKVVENTLRDVLDEVMENVTKKENSEMYDKLLAQMNATQVNRVYQDKQTEVSQQLSDLQDSFVDFKNHTTYSFVHIQEDLTSLDGRVTIVEQSVTDSKARLSLLESGDRGSKPEQTESPPLQEPVVTKAAQGSREVNSPDKTSESVPPAQEPTEEESLDTRDDGTQHYLNIPGVLPDQDFGAWDTDTDGNLSYDELQQVLGQDAPSSKEFNSALTDFDVDRDGSLSLEEFSTALGTS